MATSPDSVDADALPRWEFAIRTQPGPGETPAWLTTSPVGWSADPAESLRFALVAEAQNFITAHRLVVGCEVVSVEQDTPQVP